MIDRRNFLKGLIGSGIFMVSTDGVFNSMPDLFSADGWKRTPRDHAESARMPVVKVVGVGGGGCNAVSALAQLPASGAEYIAIDTDAEQMALTHVPTQLLIGNALIHGNQATGQQATSNDLAKKLERILSAQTWSLYSQA